MESNVCIYLKLDHKFELDLLAKYVSTHREFVSGWWCRESSYLSNVVMNFSNVCFKVRVVSKVNKLK